LVDSLIVAVGHEAYADMSPGVIRSMMRGDGSVLADVKGLYCPRALASAGIVAWRL
jgi:UDP-N-acetyl-D-galactosamine dehydrogenase